MDRTFHLWFDQNYPELSGHGIWLRGGELNTCNPVDFNSSDFKILISRLSSYRDTADSITHKIIYQIARNIPGTFVDMAFLPPPKDALIFDRDEIPWLLGTSTKRDALQFDMLAISNSIVQELINIPVMLKRSGIPLSKHIRLSRNDVPLIILGGANALNTSALLGDDPVVDGIFAGEDCDVIEKIFSICQKARGKKTKSEVLLELNSVPGFFQPDKGVKTSKYSLPTLTAKGLLHNAPVFFEEEQPGRGKLQISEGCPCFCSFCAESWGRKPYREFSTTDLLAHVPSMKASMGLDSVELYSFNFNMYGDFYSLLWNLHTTFSSVGLKSQRFDFIADSHELPRILHVAGKSSITCGLEGISSRLRAYLHKSLTDKNLKSSLNLLLRAPIRELKIFLIATGLENEQDFQEFRDLLTDINEMMVSAGRKPRIIFSMTPLVRFPFTPLEFEVAPHYSVYKKTIEQIERLIKCRGFEFRASCELQEYILSQILTRANNPAILNSIIDACKETGFIYYQEVTDLFIDSLKNAMTQHGVCFDDAISGKNWTEESRVPVQVSFNPEFHSYLRENCTSFKDIGYCMGTAEEEGECRGCGACPDNLTKEKITSLRPRSSYSPEKLKEKIAANARDCISISFKVNIPYEKRGISRQIIAMAVARVLMLQDCRIAEGYRGFVSSAVLDSFSWPWIFGLDYLSLKWNNSAAAILKDTFQNADLISGINKELAGWCEIKGIDLLPQQKTGFKLLISSSFPFNCNSWLKDNALKCTVYKNSSGAYCHQFNPQALKKKIVNDLQAVRDGNSYLVKVSPAEKFVLPAFIKSSFQFSTENDFVRLNIECINSDDNA